MSHLVHFKDLQADASWKWKDIQTHGDFHDVTLACDDGKVIAHKAVLSNCSPVLRKLLKNHPHQYPLLFLQGVKFSDLANLTDFMYEGEVNISKQQNLNEFQNLLKELKVIEDLKVEQIFPKLFENKTLDIKEKDRQPQALHDVVVVCDKEEIQTSFVSEVKKENMQSLESPQKLERVNTVLNETNRVEKYKTENDFLKRDIEPTDDLIDAQEQNFEDDSKSIIIEHRNEYLCEHCNVTLTRKYYLKRHIQRYHNPDNLKLKLNSEDRFKCDFCDKSYLFQKDLSSHMKMIHKMKSFNCKICSFQTDHRAAIWRHKTSAHSDERPYLCTMCAKGFKKKESLQKHVQTTHGNETFPCSGCGKVFKCEEYLRFHEKFHMPDELFYCTECGKGFVTNMRLNEHKNTHTCEKPFSCTHSSCNKRFRSSSAMYHHIKACSLNTINNC